MVGARLLTVVSALLLHVSLVASCNDGFWSYIAEQNNNGSVTVINCVAKSMGIVPTEIGLLTDLVRLRLKNCVFDVDLPTELGLLTKLTELTFSVNKNVTSARGTIPTEVGLLTNLTKISFVDSHRSGSIPTEIASLTNCTSFLMRSNDLTGPIPTELGFLTGITDLTMGYNDLVGTIPTELGRLGKLSQLQITANDLEGTLPEELGNCTALTKMYFRQNKLSGTIPSSYARLPIVRDFYFASNDLTGTIPDFFRGAIQKVQLQHNDLTGPLPMSFASLTNLETLQMNNNRLNGSLPDWDFLTRSLKSINLLHNDLTGTIPSSISSWFGIPSSLLLLGNHFSGTVPELPSFSSSVDVYSNMTFLATDEACPVSGAQCASGLCIAGFCCSEDCATPAPTPSPTLCSMPLSVIVATENVTEIDCPDTVFTGEIPSGIGEMDLRVVNIPRHRLSGTIPPGIGNLTNLQYLNLARESSALGRGLSGPLPPGMIHLTHLQHVDVSYNSLDGSIPSMKDLQNLTLLNLEHNRFTGLLPLWVSSLTSLSNLQLLPNYFSASSIDDLPAGVASDVEEGFLYGGVGSMCQTVAACASETCIDNRCCVETRNGTVCNRNEGASPSPTPDPEEEEKGEEDFTSLIILVAVGGGLALLILLASFLTHQPYYRFITLLVAVIDIATDLVFAFHLLLEENSSVRIYGLLSIAFVACAMISNIIALSVFFQAKFKHDPEFKAWLERNITGVSLIRVVSTLSCDLFRVTSSGLHGKDLFSAPLTPLDQRWLTVLGLINTVVEDIPQIVVVVLSSQVLGKITSLSLITLTMSALSAICSLVFRCSALQFYVLKRRDQSLPDKPVDASRSDSKKQAETETGEELRKYSLDLQSEPELNLHADAQGLEEINPHGSFLIRTEPGQPPESYRSLARFGESSEALDIDLRDVEVVPDDSTQIVQS